MWHGVVCALCAAVWAEGTGPGEQEPCCRGPGSGAKKVLEVSPHIHSMPDRPGLYKMAATFTSIFYFEADGPAPSPVVILGRFHINTCSFITMCSLTGCFNI